ncbi:MAG: polysaccharide biosynthesis C-terminal domain-containing protein [Clostridia bacterium]|nr:polysaccharide biosynthesis C-terminal domain-containing protein [Clostridia bacterium]
MNKYTKLISNTLVFGLGQFLSKAMVYLLMPLYTSVLTKEQSSAADLIQQIGNFLMPIAALGICEGLLRFAMDSKEGDNPDDGRKRIFSSSMAILTVATLAFTALSPLGMLFGQGFGYVTLTVSFVIAANLQMAVSYYIRSLGYTKLYAVQGIVNTALTIAFNILFLVILGWNVTGFILAITLANLLVTVLLIVRLKLWRDFDLKMIDKGVIKELIVYSLPLIPTTIIWSVTNITDKLIVIEYAGEAVNGMFTYSYKIPTVLTLLTTVFVEAWQLSSVKDSDEKTRGEFFTTVFSYYNGLIFMAASFLVALIKILTRLLLNVSYYGAWEYMPTLIFATVFSAFSTFVSTVYMVRKKSLPAFFTAFAGAAANIILSLALAPYLGVHGVALATVVSYLILFFIRALTAKKYVPFHIGLPRIAVNSLLLGAQCVLMVLEVSHWQLWQGVFFAAILVFNSVQILATVKKLLKKFLKRA